MATPRKSKSHNRRTGKPNDSDKVSVSPLPKGLHWPGPNDLVDATYARLAVKKGNAGVLARYLRQHTRDIIVREIATMLEPQGKSEIRLVPTMRRGRGRPPKSKVRKDIESLTVSAGVATKLKGKPGFRGYKKQAVGQMKQESNISRRTIYRRMKYANR